MINQFAPKQFGILDEPFSLVKRNRDVIPNKFIVNTPVQQAGSLVYDILGTEPYYSDGSKWIPFSKNIVAGTGITLTDIGTGIMVDAQGATSTLLPWAQNFYSDGTFIVAGDPPKSIDGTQLFGDDTYFGSTSIRIEILNSGYYKLILCTTTSTSGPSNEVILRGGVTLDINGTAQTSLEYTSSALTNVEYTTACKVIKQSLNQGDVVTVALLSDASWTMDYTDTRLWIEPIANGQQLS